MLVYVCEVEYIGWNEYGDPLHENPTGSQLMCRNPFPALPTILPLWPVVRSLMDVATPAAESCMVTLSLSPGFITKTSGVGVNVDLFAVSGPGGPTGTPSCVRNAKFTGSM